MSYFIHSQRRGTLFAPLAALLLVLPFAPAAHSQGNVTVPSSGVTQSECNAELGLGRVAWDSASGSCVVLDELILLVPSIEKAKEELAKYSDWTVISELSLVGVLVIRHSTQLSLAELKAHQTTFTNADWTSIVDLNAIASITSQVPVEDPVDDDGSTAVFASPLALPLEFALADNYPNPFNPATTIGYVLPAAADVRLEVFNLAGQHITTLVSAYQLAGRHAVEWDATNAQGQAVASGVYFYRLQAAPSTARDEFGAVKRMLLIR